MSLIRDKGYSFQGRQIANSEMLALFLCIKNPQRTYCGFGMGFHVLVSTRGRKDIHILHHPLPFFNPRKERWGRLLTTYPINPEKESNKTLLVTPSYYQMLQILSTLVLLRSSLPDPELDPAMLVREHLRFAYRLLQCHVHISTSVILIPTLDTTFVCE